MLRLAVRAGLLARHAIDYGDLGSIGISDAPSTTVRLHAAGRRVLRVAYALGVAGARVPPAQAAARRALARFVAALPTHQAGQRYTPRALVVFLTPGNAGGQPASGPAIRWPLPGDLARAGRALPAVTGSRCLALHGSAAQTLLERLRTAHDGSRWVGRAGRGPAYALIARALLPDERSCASLAA